MIERTTNHRAWFMVLPVLVLVAFNAIIPLMTVVNYSVQETFGNNVFFWEGVKWFQEVIRSERFHASLLRQMLFTLIILLIEVPLGVAFLSLLLFDCDEFFLFCSSNFRCIHGSSCCNELIVFSSPLELTLASL